MAEEVNALQQTIRQMNEEAGNPPPAIETPAATPTPTPAPAKNPVPAPAANATPESKTPGTEDGYTPPEPAFLRKEDQPAATDTPAVEVPVAQVQDEAFYSRLSEMTAGSIKTQDDMVELINDYNSLLEEAEKGFEPKFKDERAKWAYQLLTQNEGNEISTAMRTLRALDFKAEGKGHKDILFEGYLLDPKNSDLSQTQAAKYFEAEFDDKYSLIGKEDSELTPEQVRQKLVQERNLAQATREAKDNLQKIQTEFKTSEPKASGISEDVVKKIGTAVQDFAGVKLAFTDNPTELDYLNISVEDQQELAQLQHDALNPNKFWEQFMSKFDLTTQKGYSDYITELYMMKNHHKNRQAAYDHGFKAGDLARINKARNASNPKDVSQVATPSAAPKPTFFQSWEQGAAKAGR